MATPVNCPNCGSQLPPGAPACARCGERFDAEIEPVVASAPIEEAPPPPKPPSAMPSPRATSSSGTGPASSGDAGKALQQYLGELRERWGLEATPFFIGVVVLAGLAVALGTIAHIILLTAGDSDASKHFDYPVWLTTAGGFAFIALVVAVLVRREGPGTPPPPDMQSIDFRVGVAIGGLAALFALIGTVLGMGGHFEAAESWERYAAIFAFLSATWLILSQPVPELIGTTKATTIGLVVAAVAIVMLLIGQVQGLSNSYDTYVGGISWQAMAISIIVLDLGWFLGMQPRR